MSETSAITARHDFDGSSEAVPATETPVVEVRNLTVRYGKLHAVKGISFVIPRGEVFGFIGPNGAGKSSTIRVLATLQRKYTGTVCINGIDVREDPATVRSMIGYMPDFFGVADDLTARQYLHFFAAAYRIPLIQREGIVRDVLELTDLTHKIDDPIDALSRGMKQRLALARVLIHDPDLLLLDEPASGLDPRARIEMRELLTALKEMGKTILISSHILHELSKLCTRIGIIEAGDFVTEGSLDDIYSRLDLQQTVHVQVVDPPPEFEQQLAALKGVTSVERLQDRFTARFEPDVLPLEDLHDAIVKMNVRIRAFQPEAMDMEAAFLKLTEGKTA